MLFKMDGRCIASGDFFSNSFKIYHKWKHAPSSKFSITFLQAALRRFSSKSRQLSPCGDKTVFPRNKKKKKELKLCIISTSRRTVVQHNRK